MGGGASAVFIVVVLHRVQNSLRSVSNRDFPHFSDPRSNAGRSNSPVCHDHLAASFSSFGQRGNSNTFFPCCHTPHRYFCPRGGSALSQFQRTQGEGQLETYNVSLDVIIFPHINIIFIPLSKSSTSPKKGHEDKRRT